MLRITDVRQIESEVIRRLFVYWQSKCRNGAIPRRQDIDPSDIAAVLPQIIMVDFEQHPFRVRYRLVGTHIVEMTGFEFTGRYLDEIASKDVQDDFLECYRKVSEDKVPLLSRMTWRFTDDVTGTYDLCVLPLDDDGRVATKAIAVECYARLEKKVVP